MGVPASQIKIAIDLPVLQMSSSFLSVSEKKNDGVLKIIFLSRLSPMKNLDFALQVLIHLNCNIQFDIYGPVEDPRYWEKCKLLIEALPDNINCTYFGSAAPENVRNIFSSYDLFFFPTRGENYGHVVAESISVGTPVLLSDQTPWRNLEADGLGWDIPLDNIHKFADKINIVAQLSPLDREQQRIIVKQRAQERLLDPAATEANRELFYSLVRDSD
ncbi:Glycosyl transferases group 1 [compost metagenome]